MSQPASETSGEYNAGAILNENEFTARMTELLPGADSKGVRNLIEYAKELDERDTEPLGNFFRDTAIEYYLVTQQYGQEIARQLLGVCETFALNPFELRGAAWHIQNGASPADIPDLAREGECDPPHGESLIAAEALTEFEAARNTASGPVEKPSVLAQIRGAAKTPTAPKTGEPSRKKQGPEL